VLVDEVQDVNRLQADPDAGAAAPWRGLTPVGDDAQSIYAFRGADVRHILDCRRVLTHRRNGAHAGAQLPQHAAQVLAAPMPSSRWPPNALPRRCGPTTVACRPRLHVVADEAAQARGVADAVLAEREAGLLAAAQAVLFRTSSHSAPLELELTRRGVPFVKYGGLRFLEAAHVKDLLSVLRWADNPGSRLAAQRVARLVPGMGPASVARLLAITPGHWKPSSHRPQRPPPWATGAADVDAAVARRRAALARVTWPRRWPGTNRTWSACTTTPACAGPICSSCSTSPAATPAASAS
jgi:DNA helicase-2/ATP-dependent DNA helicase PcrA